MSATSTMANKESAATKLMHRLSIISTVDKWAADFPEYPDELKFIAGQLLSDLTPSAQRALGELSKKPRVHFLEWGATKCPRKIYGEK